MDSRQPNQPFSRLLPQQRPLQVHHQAQHPPPPPPPYSSLGRSAMQQSSLPPSSTHDYRRENEVQQRPFTPPIQVSRSLQQQSSASHQILQGPQPLQSGGYHARRGSRSSGASSGTGDVDRSPQGESGPRYGQSGAMYINDKHAPPNHAYAQQQSTSSTSPHGSRQQMSQSHLSEEPRRPSLGASPPRIFRGISDQPPPPPPPYSNRHMPPPSSPQTLQSAHTYPTSLARGPPPPPPPPFSAGRDLPALSTINRPGSSMSISSMLGSAADPQSRDSATPASQYRPPSAAPTSAPSPKSHSAPVNQTARTASETGGTSFPPDRRHESPERVKDGNLRGPRDSRASSAGSPSRPLFRPGATSPERSRPSASTSQAKPFNNYVNITQGPQPATSSPTNPTGDSLPRRPNSQPAVAMAPQGDPDEGRSLFHPGLTSFSGQSHGQGPDPSLSQQDNSLVRDPEGPRNRSQHDQPANFDNLSQRTNTQKLSQGSNFARHQAQGDPDVGGRRNPLWGVPTSQHGLLDHRQQAHPNPGSTRPFGSGFQSYSNMSASPFVTANLLNGKGDSRQGDTPNQQPTQTGQDQRYRSPSREGTSLDRRRRNYSRTPTPSAGATPVGGSATFDQQRKGSEDLHQPRNLLSVGSNNSRKGGRISPMPQAVQGAQGQMSGPGGEPGIKTEFGKMFSGIGSGVGSAMSVAGPMSNGNHTPAFQSPSNRDTERNIPSRAGADTGDAKVPRTGSGGNKRVRKVKDEESKVDSESGDGRGTPNLENPRGAKRNKHSHSHHHHHQPPHHHHHHPPKHVDGSASPMAAGTMNSTVNNQIGSKRNSTPLRAPSVTASASSHHHHHHHHHRHPPPHHHHHVSKAVDYDVPAPERKPTVTIINTALINSVSKQRRCHLGSSVYAPRLSLPSSTASHERLSHGYTSTPTPIPRFRGKANCTFTVRVPYQYLVSKRREEIVLRRALWGTDIYTDDSDPLAAAIHSGWIRGAWSGDFDRSLLELDVNQPASTKTSAAPNKISSKDIILLTEPPATGPMEPPPKKDLHITLLILPTLEAYVSTIMHGLKSRKWGNNHDGMSFKILKLAWLNEGAQRGEARGGEAKRKRLNAYIESQRSTIDSREALTQNESNEQDGQM